MNIKLAGIVLILLCIGVLTGCINPEAFRPSPPYYKSWSKPGATMLEIKKQLLECGDSSPSGGTDKSFNESALVHFCMVNLGYSPIGFKGRKEDPLSWCKNRPDLPACQPRTVIPKPSAERRLSSQYCKLRVSYEYCMRFNKEREGRICNYRNFDNPPPECLP